MALPPARFPVRPPVVRRPRSFTRILAEIYETSVSFERLHRHYPRIATVEDRRTAAREAYNELMTELRVAWEEFSFSGVVNW
jgi:hypothetical protein